MVNKIIALIITFILAYMPIIFGINLLHVVALISVVYCIMHYGEALRFFLLKENIILILLLGITSIYLLLVTQFNKTSIQVVAPIIYLIIEVLPTSFMIISLIHKKRKIQLNDLIITAAIVQGVIAIITYIFPSIQNFFVSQLIDYGASNVYMKITEHRMYGFSNFLTFATPALQAIIVFFIFIKIPNEKNKYLLALPIIIFSALINARTSIVVLLIALILTLLFKMSGNWMKILLSLILLITISTFIFSDNALITSNIENNNFAWLIDGYNEIIGFINGNYDSGYFSYVTNADKYLLPLGINLIFGKGLRVMHGDVNYFISDIGYINDIWLGGIFYVIFLSIIFIYMLYKSKKMLYNNKNSNLIVFFIIITMLALNFKGFIFGFNPVVNILMLMYYNLLYEYKFVVNKDV